jgi:hypothetical protein
MEHVVLPWSVLDRHLKTVIPYIVEILNYLKVYVAGDGFRPNVREGLARLNIQGWAKLYLDPANAMKAPLLILMSPQQINEWNQEMLAKSPTEQAAYVEVMLKDFEILMVEDEAPEETIGDIDPQRLAQFWYFTLPTIYNQLSYIAHHKSLYQLVAEAIAGNDTSYLKAIQADKTTLTTIPYFIDRNRRAADEGDINFLRQINTYRQKPILESRSQRLPLMMLFSYLYQMNLLDELAKDAEKLLRLCEDAGVYGSQGEAADLESFKKALRRFNSDQQIALSRPQLMLVVKDMSSSK